METGFYHTPRGAWVVEDPHLLYQMSEWDGSRVFPPPSSLRNGIHQREQGANGLPKASIKESKYTQHALHFATTQTQTTHKSIAELAAYFRVGLVLGLGLALALCMRLCFWSLGTVDQKFNNATTV